MPSRRPARPVHGREKRPAEASADALAREIEALRAEVARLRARLAETEVLADVDPLAPVMNRRAFMRELERTIAFVGRYGGAAVLIYFDLNGFKAVNDRFGHAAGDLALRTVAERLVARVRKSDVVGRLGGDEFAVVLARTDWSGALAKAEALAGAIADEAILSPEGPIELSAAYGIAEIRGGEAAEAVLAQADAAMFMRKETRLRS